MRPLIVIEYVSVDGVVQAPGHAAEDREGGFAHGGWTGPHMDDHGRYMREALNTMGALLLGRLTYEIWASYWPTVTDPADEIARMLNTVPKYVASSTLTNASWPETTVIDDVPRQVGELKQQSGKAIVVIGSSGLAQSLMRHDLVDEYRLMIHPVVLGAGKRLFREPGALINLRLSEATTTSSGLATLTYQTTLDELVTPVMPEEGLQPPTRGL
jgi:dihydrofolate reductase